MFGRLGLCLVSLLGLMSLMSASAFGAGAPTEMYWAPGATKFTSTNSAELSGVANPNGANTTLTIEYREPGAAEFKVAGSGNIGSGTKLEFAYAPVIGVKPNMGYETRAKATNQYGTAYSPIGIWTSPVWRVKGFELTHVADVKATGTATFEWPLAGQKYKLSCEVNGNGSIGGKWGTGTGIAAELSGCGFYRNSVLQCKPSPGNQLELDQAFVASKIPALWFSLAKGCYYSETVEFVAQTPFSATMSKLFKYELNQSLVMTNQLLVAGSPVTATISTNWSLAGMDIGKSFGVFEA